MMGERWRESQLGRIKCGTMKGFTKPVPSWDSLGMVLCVLWSYRDGPMHTQCPILMVLR